MNQILTKSDRESILKDYLDISVDFAGDYSEDKVRNASSGMYINRKTRNKKTKEQLMDDLAKCYKHGKMPLVNEDSMTAWCNKAAWKCGLTVGDILKMKKGDEFRVLLMDRNVGDYTYGLKVGDTYRPVDKGLSYAKYTHIDGLKGILYHEDVDITYDVWQWEVNLGALGNGHWFWGPLSLNNCTSCDKDNSKCKEIDVNTLDPRIQVGWRGPCIKRSDAQKLPEYVTHYCTWWDDFSPFKYHDFLKME